MTATAHVSQIVWDMGDGHTVTCGAGTPCKESEGAKDSPICGYRYATTSNGGKGDVFRVTATATWNAHWAGRGQRGDLTTTRSSQVQLRVGEVQVLGVYPPTSPPQEAPIVNPTTRAHAGAVAATPPASPPTGPVAAPRMVRQCQCRPGLISRDAAGAREEGADRVHPDPNAAPGRCATNGDGPTAENGWSR
ncbi:MULTISPECIES: hypothetical protein [unclassified Streptomyces]|uniref:hypothetical protein n=1 Tax=unclassified Streptomyces TaxID=2593676 RepID=UPI0003A19499|nr:MULTISPECIES: hypothetical protein [unclassified Streptomyces]